MTAETPPAGDRTPDDSLPESVPPPSPASQADEDAPSTEFAEALAQHERADSAVAKAEAATHEPRVGQKVHARVVSISDTHAILDFGGRSEGVTDLKHHRKETGELKIGVGDEIDLFVVEVADPVVLAPTMKAKGGAALQKLRDAKEAGVPISGKVTGVNAGGLSVDLGGVRGFCPKSQIELGFCSDPNVYVGRVLDFLVSEVKDGRSGAVVSRRQLLRRAEADKGKELLATLEPGAEVEGTVERLEPFGAFVDIGGVDGLVHISEISHDRIGHPSHALKKGDRVRARVLKVEPGKGGKPRIALSIRAATPDPWEGAETRFAPGARVTGTVARLTDFGAFVTLAPGVDGLVHVSEAAPHRVAHVKEVLSPGQSVEAVVRSIEPEKRRISLSIREAMGGAAVARRQPAAGETTEGVVAAIKPFGVFVDLTDYGPRVTGMIPHEESGQPRGADLALAFSPGQKVRVVVLEPKQGKVRLQLEGVTPRREARPARAAGTEMEAPAAEPGATPEPGRARPERARGRSGGGRPGSGGDEARGPSARGGRGRRSRDEGRRDRDRESREDDDGGERGGDRGSRRETRTIVVSTRPAGEELTPMAIALRKAMEKAEKKNKAKSE